MNVNPLGFNNLVSVLRPLADVAAATPAAAPVCASQPNLFTPQTPTTFIKEIEKSRETLSIDKLENEIKKLETVIAKLQKELDGIPGNNQIPAHYKAEMYQATLEEINKAKSQLSEKYALRWIFFRNIGKERPEDLKRAIELLPADDDSWAKWRRGYWMPQLAMIISSELENPAFKQALEKIFPNLNKKDLWKNNAWKKDNEIKLVEIEKLVLEQIFTVYLEGKKNMTLMAAENLFRRALLEKSLGNVAGYKDLIKKAKELANILATTESFDKRIDNLGRLKDHIPALTLGSGKQKARELRRHFATANLLMAKILMLEANDLKSSSEVQKKLEKAREYLPNTDHLDALGRLDARQVLAEIHLRQGFELKNTNDPGFICSFAAAKEELDYILDWKTKYNTEIKDGKEPKMLAQTAAFAQFSLLKLQMVMTGEIKCLNGTQVIALFGANLEKADRDLLARETGKVQVLAIQKKLLEKYDAQLEALARSNLIRGLSALDLKLLQAENHARRAFIAKDMGDKSYSSLLAEAEKKLEGLDTTDLDPQIKAMAQSWKAKLIIFRALEKDLKPEIQRAVAPAKELIKQAIGSGELRDALLSYAHQALGEILLLEENLKDAEDEFKKARTQYPGNHEAVINLADVLSQRGDQAGALKLYSGIAARTRHHLIYERAQLGMAEARMRLGEHYSRKNRDALEKLLFGENGLFKTEPAGSFLIPRSIDALLEAYSVNEDLHIRIVLIANILLGNGSSSPTYIDQLFADTLRWVATQSKDKAKNNFELAEQFRLIKKMTPLKESFKARLYLKLAEGLSWIRQYDEARKIMNEIRKGNAPLVLKDPELFAAYRLLDAEIMMRKERDVKPILSDALPRLLLDTRNPDLVSRYVLDLIEGFSYEKKFSKIVDIADHYLEPDRLGLIKSFFERKGRLVSYEKFVLTVLKKRADAYFWDKKYDHALIALDELKGRLSGDFAQLLGAQIDITYGEIYLSRGEFDEAKKHYTEAKNVLQEIEKDEEKRSNKTDLALAEAYIGLGELARYGTNPNLAEANKLYDKANAYAKKLPEGSEDQLRLQARIYYGKAEVAKMNGDQHETYALCNIAADQLGKLRAADNRLKIDIHNTCNNAAVEVGLSANAGTQVVTGGDGRFESQYLFKVNVPFRLRFPSMKRWHFTIDEQLDKGVGTTRWANYFGLNYKHPLFTASLQAKAGHAGRGEEMIFFRQPSYKANLSHWNRYFSVDGSVNISAYDFKSDSHLNTYFIAAGLNGTWLKNKWLQGAHLGVTYNFLHYNYTDVNRFLPRHQLGYGLRYKTDLTPWFRVQAILRGLAYSSETRTDIGNGVFDRTVRWYPGFEAGIGGHFNLGRYFRFSFNYLYQHISEYPMHTASIGLGYSR